jgi:hypothetical protein
MEQILDCPCLRHSLDCTNHVNPREHRNSGERVIINIKVETPKEIETSKVSEVKSALSQLKEATKEENQNARSPKESKKASTKFPFAQQSSVHLIVLSIDPKACIYLKCLVANR